MTFDAKLCSERSAGRRTAGVCLLWFLVACGPEASVSTQPTAANPPIGTPQATAAVAGRAAVTPVAPQVTAGTSSVTAPNTTGTVAVATAAGAPAPPEITQPTAALGFCDVQPVLKADCQNCHAAQPLFGAPMPLMTYADLQAPSKSNPAKAVYKLVAERVHDMQKPMPPVSNMMQLTAEQRAKLDAWTAAGAPQGANAVCPDVPADATKPNGMTAIPGRAISNDTDEWPADCGEHYKLLASGTGGKKYQVGAGRQFYANVNIPAPWGNKQVQALRFRAIVDNRKVLHHYILYGPDQAFIDGWAPGQQGITMPDGVGMALPDGTYRLELHYNNAQGTSAEEDASGIEVCVAKTPRPKTAAVHELGSMLINIPAHGKQDLVNTCKPTISGGEVHLMEVNPHMHTLGVHAKLVLKRAGGQEMVVHDKPFSFDDQQKYILPEDGSAADIVMKPGDTLTSTCSYNNTTNLPVMFGQNTENEMCFFYVIAWPMGQLVNGSRGPEGDPNACM